MAGVENGTLLCDGQVRRKLSSELIGSEVTVRELSRVLTFEAPLSSPLSLHELRGALTPHSCLNN